MDDFNNNDRLTTADIANPSASADERLREDRLESATRGSVQSGTLEREQRMNSAPVEDISGGAMQSSSGSGQQHMALFPNDELQNYRTRWDKVQTSFVDEPRKAVEDADSLVANVVKRLAEQFASERANLEKQWDKGGDVSTEDLRQGLRRYRAFFDRLLSV